MLLKALIFDVDGTLAETEEAHRQAFNEAFAAFGLDWIWDKELYRELLQVTGGKERLQYYIEHWEPSGSDLAQARFGEIYALASARYAALVGSGATPIRRGVRRLIMEAHQRRVRLAIATTSAPASVEALLRAMLGEAGPSAFAVVAAGDMVERKKPAPDVYRFALAKLECDPCSCIAIEDSENGVKAATAAGLPVIALPSHYLSGDDFSLATTVLSDLGDPDRPCRHIAGIAFGQDYVDIDGLEGWLSKLQRVRAGPQAGRGALHRPVR